MLTVGVLLLFVTAAGLGLPGRPSPTSHRDAAAPEAAAPRPAHSGPSERPARQAAGAPVRWSRVLTGLDERRAQAWRRGRPGRLRAVFAADSAVLHDDTAALRDYLRRGYAVSGVHIRFLRVHVVDRDGTVVTLRVVDRLGTAVARRGDGSSVRLPSDLPSRHLVRLVDGRSGWRIAAVHAS